MPVVMREPCPQCTFVGVLEVSTSWFMCPMCGHARELNVVNGSLRKERPGRGFFSFGNTQVEEYGSVAISKKSNSELAKSISKHPDYSRGFLTLVDPDGVWHRIYVRGEPMQYAALNSTENLNELIHRARIAGSCAI